MKNVKNTFSLVILLNPKHKPVSGKLTIRRNVVFNEATSWGWGEEQAQQGIPMDISSVPPPEPTPASNPASSPESSPTSSPSRNSSSDVEKTSATPPLRRLTRIRKPNPQYADSILHYCSTCYKSY